MNLDYELLKITICSIIEDIELWENTLMLKYSDCLERIIKKIEEKMSYYIENKALGIEIILSRIINIIFRYYINIIENCENDISSHYIKGFDNIIDILSENKRTKIERDIIELVCSMGSFGKKNYLRRFSLFFCTSFIKVIKKIIKYLRFNQV
jgi:hypothetical protein